MKTKFIKYKVDASILRGDKHYYNGQDSYFSCSGDTLYCEEDHNQDKYFGNKFSLFMKIKLLLKTNNLFLSKKIF